MTDKVSLDHIDLPGGELCFHIAMTAPRANALEPEFLKELHRALDALEASGAQKALITGGRNFSSGGDVGRFLEAAQEGRAEAHADKVVPLLQDLVLRMLRMPVLIASAVRGAATGGSAGIVFASDLVAVTPDAFVQPYYGVMGYAPDGGWTATLPELIGAAPAREWLLCNHRHGAQDLQRLGLAQAVDEEATEAALSLLTEVETGMALATKQLIWNSARLALVRDALAAETAAFRKLIDRPDVLSRMTQFLQPTR